MRKLSVVCAVVLCAVLPAFAESLADWTHQAAIVFNGYDGTAPLTNFPALVRLSEGAGGFSYAKCRADGGDVRFSGRNGVILDSECVTWNPGGVSEFWVKVPLLYKDAAIGIHWGNSAATKPQSFRNVWNDNYLGVWHLDEVGKGILDSTPYSTAGVATSDGGGADGIAGRCRTFVEANKDYAKLGNESYYRPVDKVLSLECWFKQAALPASGYRVLVSHSQSWNEGFLMAEDASGVINVKVGPGYELTAAVSPELNTWHHLLYTIAADKTASLYFDGALVASGSKTLCWPDGYLESHMLIGHSETQNSTFKESYFDGSLDEYRMSSVVRSADYAKAVFMNAASNHLFQSVAASPAAGTLTITGNEVPPTESEIYGLTSGLSVGASVAARVPEIIEDNEKGVRYVCKGYEIYVNGNLSSSGEGCSYEGTFPSGANDVVLSWVWEKSYKFTISAGENGSVEPSGEKWMTAGSNVVVTATPASEAYGFYRWQGDCPETSVYTATLTLPADKPRTLTAAFGNAWYVSRAENASDENNGNSPDVAFATMTKALEAAADGDAIWIGDGSYTNGSTITIDKSVAIRSLGGAEKTIFDGKGSYKVFHLNKADTYLQGLTVRKGAIGSNWNNASGIHAESGAKIQDCIIENCSGSCANTPAVKMGDKGWISRSIVRNGFGSSGSAGNNAAIEPNGFNLIESCIISNNTHKTAGQLSGAVWCRGNRTIVRNSLIVDNHASASSAATQKGAGVTISGWTRFENCTIADNDVNGYGGGIYIEKNNVSAVNTILDGNTAAASDATDGNNGDIYGNAAFNHSLSSHAPVGNADGNISATANFADGANGDFRLASSSLARDAGIALVWQENGLDLGGTNRLLGAAVDIGAYEYVPSANEPLACSFTLTTKKTDAGLEATVTAIVVGSNKENLIYTWNFGDGTIVTGSEYGVVTHTYTEPGTYTVTLNVSNGNEENAEFLISDGVELVPDICYVSTTGNSIPPYHTWENAATNIFDALTILCKRIEIGEGTFYPKGSASIIISRAVELVGQGPDKTVFDLGFNGNMRVTLNNSEAVLSGVTIRNGSASWNTVSLLELYAGTVSNCIMENATCFNIGPVLMQDGHLVNCTIRNTSNNADNHRNSALYLRGGFVENCVISNNVCGNVDCTGGTGIYVASDGEDAARARVPTIRNCLVAENKGYKMNVTKNNIKGGAGILLDKKAILENCTIVGNQGSGVGIGLHLASGAAGTAVTNCIIADNIVTNPVVDGVELPSSLYAEATSIATNLYINAAATYDITTSCSPDLGGIGEGNITAAPRFRGKGEAPYSLRNTSPCVGKGTLLDWMTLGVDLIGKPRLFGTKPDMGAYELQRGAGLFILIK